MNKIIKDIMPFLDMSIFCFMFETEITLVIRLVTKLLVMLVL